LGRQIRIPLLSNPGHPSVLTPEGGDSIVTVIGIVGDIRNNGLRNKPAPAALIPFTLLAPPQRAIAIRSHTDPTVMLKTLRTEVCALDKDQPLGRIWSFNEVLGFETAQPRFTMALFSFFGALGLALAGAGIYSVLSYLVTRRTREIGIRMALGAQIPHVLRLVISSGGKLALAGMTIGLLAGFAMTRLLGSLLYEVTAMDPLTYAGVTLLLGAVALLACYIPARRAARVDPMEALRYE